MQPIKQTTHDLPEPKATYYIQVLWRNLSSKGRLQLQEKLDIDRSTLWRWRNDPAAMPFCKALAIADFFALENPRDLVDPADLNND